MARRCSLLLIRIYCRQLYSWNIHEKISYYSVPLLRYFFSTKKENPFLHVVFHDLIERKQSSLDSRSNQSESCEGDRISKSFKSANRLKRETLFVTRVEGNKGEVQGGRIIFWRVSFSLLVEEN